MNEDLELKLIRNFEQKEKERNERLEKLMYENTKSFEDFFYESLSNKLKRIAINSNSTLEDFLLEDGHLANIPVNIILTDNIKNKTELETIINNTFENAYTSLAQKSDKVTVEKFYTHSFAISYNATVQIVITNPEYISRFRGFNPGAGAHIVKTKNDNLWINLSRFNVLNSVNINNHTKGVKFENLKTIKTKKKFSYIYKKLLNNLTTNTKKQILKDSGYFLSSVKLYSLTLKHVLCPVYKVRFFKPGFDAEFVINAQTKTCEKL